MNTVQNLFKSISRWLLGKGRNEEAKAILDKYAKSKNVELIDGDWEKVVRTENDKVEVKWRASF